MPTRWTPPRRVRPIAIALIRDGGRLLVMECHNGERTYYRPLGGEIEFGERGEAAVHRELLEEIDLELGSVRYLDTIENHYVLDGHPGHEIVLVYDAELPPGSTVRDRYVVTENGEATAQAVWLPIRDVVTGRAWLVPDGLARHLDDDV
jgi:ADP-ribose pyrophosphatase YjhB (NUDIX family)